MQERDKSTNNIIESRMQSLIKPWVDSITTLANATSGTSNRLFAVGTSAFGFALLWKLRPLGIQLSDLSQCEFLTIMVCALLLLVVGAAISVFQFKQNIEIHKASVQIGRKIIDRTLDIAVNVTKPPDNFPQI